MNIETLKEHLSTAIQNHDKEGIRQAIEAGAPVNYYKINEYGGVQRTALDYAVAVSDRSLTEFLLSRGADFRIRENRMDTAIFGSAVDDLEIFKLLVQYGADPLYRCSSMAGATPLHLVFAHVPPRRKDD